MIRENNKPVIWGIGIALLFPLFFQVSGGIYDGFLLDSRGSISNLPFPIAVFACFGGIAVLITHFRRAYVAMAFIASMLVSMLLSVVFAGAQLQVELRKVILLAQFSMPMFALILGQMVDDDRKLVPKAFLAVLLVVVPFQLIAGWMQGTLTLTHSLYVFSIYQHFQFVPIIFVCAFAYAMCSLWDIHRALLLLLLPFMLIYVIASVSFLAIAAFIIFVALFFFLRLRASGRMHGAVIAAIIMVVIALCVAGIGAYFAIAKNKSSIIGDHGQYIGKFDTLSEGKLPTNVSERLADWKLFYTGIVESPRTLAFGHVAPMAREVKTSAHNWYLDFVYNFGLISLLPMLALIVFTFNLAWRLRKVLPRETWWLSGLVAFLVLVDSNFKVTLRQPYPGIFAYFLWGLLLSRLRVPASRKLGA